MATTGDKFDRMDVRARAFLSQQYANAPALHNEMVELWGYFRNLELPNKDFMAEFTNGKKPSLAQRTWEMLLARHLHQQGHKITCPKSGPDFRFELNGTTVWVEAVAPNPEGLPAEWLDPAFQGVQTFPHEAILLRWTTALDAEWKKLTEEYLPKGVVKPSDAYVVAINGLQLATHPVTHGITQMPFGVEATVSVGPLTIKIDRETGKFGKSFISERFHITNKNKTDIPTTSFLNPSYEGISALIGCASERTLGRPLAVHVVHNPLAKVKLPFGSLGGTDDEWFAAPVADKPDEYDLQRTATQP